MLRQEPPFAPTKPPVRVTAHVVAPLFEAAHARVAMPVVFWLTLLGCAFALRASVAYVALGHMPLFSDAESYATVGLELVDSFPGRSAHFWPPGMAMLLAAAYSLLGGELWVSRLVVCTLGTVQAWLCVMLASALHLDARAIRVTGWIAALYPPAVLMSGQTFSQPLAGVLLTALAYLAIRVWRTGRLWAGGGAGLMWGLGCITRPSMLGIGPVLLVLAASTWWLRRHGGSPNPVSATAVSLGLAVAVACMAPIALYNRAHGAGLALSTNNEANFFYGNNPYTPHYKTSQLGQRDHRELDPDVRAYLDDLHNAPDPRAAMRSEALRYIVEHPGTTVWRTLNRIRAFWGFDYLMARNAHVSLNLGTGALIVLTAIEAGGYLVVCSLVLLALGSGRFSLRRAETFLVLVLVAAYQVPYALAFSAGAFHFPVMGLLIPFAGWAASRDRGLVWREVRDRPLVWAALAIFLAIQVEYAYQTIVTMNGVPD